MIKTKKVKAPGGQTFWIQFEGGYKDNKGMWRVIDIEPPEFEVGDLIGPDEIGVGWEIHEEDEEEE